MDYGISLVRSSCHRQTAAKAAPKTARYSILRLYFATQKHP